MRFDYAAWILGGKVRLMSRIKKQIDEGRPSEDGPRSVRMTGLSPEAFVAALGGRKTI